MFTGLQHVWRTNDKGGDAADARRASAATTIRSAFFPSIAACGDWAPDRRGPDVARRSATGTGEYMVATGARRSNSGTLWAATRIGRVFVSTNANASDPRRSRSPASTRDAQPRPVRRGITIDPANPNHAWVSYSGYNVVHAGRRRGTCSRSTFNPARTHGHVDR